MRLLALESNAIVTLPIIDPPPDSERTQLKPMPNKIHPLNPSGSQSD